MSEVQFVEALPEAQQSKSSAYREALLANPGKWAVYYAKNPYTAARQFSKNGQKFEGAKRAGVAYMRAVAS